MFKINDMRISGPSHSYLYSDRPGAFLLKYTFIQTPPSKNEKSIFKQIIMITVIHFHSILGMEHSNKTFRNKPFFPPIEKQTILDTTPCYILKNTCLSFSTHAHIPIEGYLVKDDTHTGDILKPKKCEQNYQTLTWSIRCVRLTVTLRNE